MSDLDRRKLEREEINRQQRERYHKGKPQTLEKAKETFKCYYWNNPEYRKRQQEKCKKYYRENPEYFEEYRKSDKYKETWRKRNESEEFKQYKKEWVEKNAEKVREYGRKYYRKYYRKGEAKKQSIRGINKRRIEKGLPPVETAEQHFQQRKEEWFKRIWFAHVYKE